MSDSMKRKPTSEEIKQILNLSNEISKVELRDECQVNRFWEFTFKSGYVAEFYASQELPREYHGEYVWEFNQELSDFLDYLFTYIEEKCDYDAVTTMYFSISDNQLVFEKLEIGETEGIQ